MHYKKLIYMISFFSGFLSLSQEILWIRILSFKAMSVPQAFSLTLGLFLLGIAFGAQIGKKLCCQNKATIGNLGKIFFIIAFIDLLILILILILAKNTIIITIIGICVFISASTRGIAFPMVHHIGANETKTGKQISNVYFSNVFGSSVAPLIISFVLLDIINTQQVYILICVTSLIIASVCLEKKMNKVISIILILIFSITLLLPERLFYRLSFGSYYSNFPDEIIENKHGFIQIYNDGRDKVIFGANVYDGKLNTNLFHNTNGIDRAYFLTTLKPHTENILVIGLSTGSWVKVLSMMPNVKKITVIEINPAYVQLIKSDPIVSDILKDSRIEIIFDDGRKWIKKHQKKQFDLVLMNTTWHWRAYTSNLLSHDFIMLVKNIIQDDGYIFYNSTQSADAYYTAKKVFPYVYQYKFMVLASKNPVQQPTQKIIKNRICSLKKISTQEIFFNNDAQCQKAANLIYATPLLPYEKINFPEFKNHQLTIITDDNMITEYKYGKGL